MNLQVDLILPTEQRSASAFNLQAVIRVMTIVGPAILLLLIALLVLGFMQINGEVKLLETQWAAVEKKKSAADALRNQVSENRDILADLTGLRNTDVEISKALIRLLQVIPANIQMAELSVTDTFELKDEKIPERRFRLIMAGSAIGKNADAEVAELKRRLVQAPGFERDMERSEVTEYGVDTREGAGRDDRAFRIDSLFNEKVFE